MTVKKLTRIEDARAMKAMGWPLDTPVVDRVMSKGAAMQYKALVKAYAVFEKAWNEFAQVESIGKWKLQRRRLDDLHRISAKAREFALAQRDGDDDSALVIAHVAMRMDEFIRYWHEVNEILEAGEPVEIRPTDIPKIFDED
jgi:hypothetical protein